MTYHEWHLRISKVQKAKKGGKGLSRVDRTTKQQAIQYSERFEGELGSEVCVKCATVLRLDEK